MTFRKFAMATAISSATAVAAFADDQGMSDDHGDIAAGTSVFSEMGVEYDMDGRSAMNIDMVNIDDAGVSSDVSDKPDTARAADTSPENILAVAKDDAEIWTSDNAAIGTAFKTEENAEGSPWFTSMWRLTRNSRSISWPSPSMHCASPMKVSALSTPQIWHPCVKPSKIALKGNA